MQNKETPVRDENFIYIQINNDADDVVTIGFAYSFLPFPIML